MVQPELRFITQTESKYAMVELELLAIIWTMLKRQLYLQGLPSFELIVDHKPLVSILTHRHSIWWIILGFRLQRLTAY